MAKVFKLITVDATSQITVEDDWKFVKSSYDGEKGCFRILLEATPPEEWKGLASLRNKRA